MLLELSLRSAITLLLVSTLAIGGCDRQSQPAEQANATANRAADNAVEEVVEEKIGTLDRGHKGWVTPHDAFKAPDGRTVTLADFKGKPVLLNLWATWCAPCIKEMPTLDALAASLGDKVQVIALSQDLEGAEKVAPFFAKEKFKALKPYLDSDMRLSTGSNVNLPTTILYDSAGKEVWRITGGMDWTSQAARDLIAEAR